MEADASSLTFTTDHKVYANAEFKKGELVLFRVGSVQKMKGGCRCQGQQAEALECGESFVYKELSPSPPAKGRPAKKGKVAWCLSFGCARHRIKLKQALHCLF